MFPIRRAADRCHGFRGWLETNHGFLLAGHAEAAHPPLGAPREDRIAPTRGVGMPPRRDLEIVTCVLEGALAGDGARIEGVDAVAFARGRAAEVLPFDVA